MFCLIVGNDSIILKPQWIYIHSRFKSKRVSGYNYESREWCYVGPYEGDNCILLGWFMALSEGGVHDCAINE